MTARMVASGIGVVLCRLFAVMLFVQALAGAGQVIDMFDDVYGKWLLVWVGFFEILTPAVVGALLWRPDSHLQFLALRVPAYAQLLLGVLLVLGRNRIAGLLLRVHRAGVKS